MEGLRGARLVINGSRGKGDDNWGRARETLERGTRGSVRCERRTEREDTTRSKLELEWNWTTAIVGHDWSVWFRSFGSCGVNAIVLD